MTTFRQAGRVIALIGALSTSLSAQWPSYPTPGVPRTADGKPDLLAPAPRMADGKPDLSGIWANTGWRSLGALTGSSGTGGSPGTPSVLPTGPGLFLDIGTGVPGGLPFQPSAAELRRKRMADNSKDNPDAHCLPMGIMQFHEHPQPRKMIQTPEVLVILYEGNAGVRQIFTDGRSLPNNDPQPWWYGYSVGRWEGDTLVVETTGVKGDGWHDINGSPQTEAVKFTERYRRPNYGTMKIDVTIDDPKAYTAPFTVRVNQKLMVDERVDAELIEFICAENEKDVERMKFLK
jgi:hypothetical protein